MRTSKYNIYIPLPDSKNYLLIHGYTGAIDLASKNIYQHLKYESFNLLTENELLHLRRRGYITSKTESEEYERVASLAKILSKYESKQKSFIFFITYNCNFKCAYCYEGNISNDSKGWTKEKFTKELTDAAYSLIASISKPAEKHGIILYGGEPFLKENSEIVHFIVKSGIKKGFKFNAISNGYELEEYEDILGKDAINFIQITIDGNEDEHNKRRPHISGKGTFQKIIKNISLALDRNVRISLRINVDKRNIDQLGSLTDIFEKNNWLSNRYFSCYLSPVHP